MKAFNYIVSVLFISGFFIISCNQPAKETTSGSIAITESQGDKIVFIDIDTLLSKYDLYKDSKASLEAQSKTAEASLGTKIEAFQKRVAKLQQDFAQAQQNAASIAPVELKKLEEKFMTQQQNLAKEEESLMKQRDNAARELETKLQELQKDLQDKIDVYLEKVAEEKQYNLVLMKGVGGSVMYGRKTLDITEETLKALNEQYSKDKK